MVPVKIECECGQHYAFDVEPANGMMPSAVACPNCGADGTTAANEYISQQLAPAAVAGSPEPGPVRLATAPVQPATVTRGDSRRGMVDRPQAEREAKAKIMWGDSTAEVASYLAVQGFSRPEAAELANRLFLERAAIIRSNGIKKIIVGCGLICTPFVALIIFKAVGVFLLKIFGLSIAAGMLGAYMVISGILMVVAPKSERGNVVKE